MRKGLLNAVQKITALLVCLSLLLTPSELKNLIAFSIEEPFYTESAVTKNGDVYAGEIGADGLHIAVSFTEEAGIPEDALIAYREIITDTKQYADYFAESSDVLNRDQAGNSNTGISLQFAKFFDISFLYEGETIEPDAPVSVEITYDRPQLDYDSYEILLDVIHFSEEQTVLMETDVEQGVLPADSPEAPSGQADSFSDMMRFETDSFSAYGLLFYYIDDHNIGSSLDGMSFALINWDKQEGETGIQQKMPAVMAEYKQDSRLAIKEVDVYPASRVDSDTDDFTNYVITDTDITQWTFTWIEDNNYYVTAEVDGVTKYLSLYSEKVKVNGSEGGKIELLDTPNEYSVITVQNNGTGTRANKLRLVNKDNWALNRKGGNNSQGYQTYGPNATSNEWTEWFVPAILTDAALSSGSGVSAGDTIHTATKVSVSDTVNLCDGAKVVVYSKVWDSENNQYVNYAIDGNGDLVKVWESGAVVQWIDSDNTSLYWDFIQYGDSGYYEFYNPVTGMYLAPQSGQILSNSTIGVTLNGRVNGNYSSTIEAWDSNIWSWYGYDYTDSLSLIPVPDSMAAQMLFAVQKETPAFTPVDTVDSKAADITIKMFDYSSNTIQNAVMGEGKWTGEGYGARKNLVEKLLDENGFPVATLTNRSLEELFTGNNEHEVNHLFIKSTYDETGYYEYSCFDNSAFLMTENGENATPSAEGYADVYDFTVYQELLSPAINTGKYSFCRGNFYPFDQVNADDWITQNKYDSNAKELTPDNPRYLEDIYAQSPSNQYNVDAYFGMSIEATFMIPENGCDENGNPLIFEFTGDDDFWLFIDDVLVLDLGGIHNALTGSVNFSTGVVSAYNGYKANTYTYSTIMDSFEAAGVFPDGTPWDESKKDSYFREDGGFEGNAGSFKDYSSHTIKIFYMDRSEGNGASCLKLRFNLATVAEDSVFLEKQLTGTQTTDYSNTLYAYQLYYRPAGSTGDYTLYENPVDAKAHYENRNDLIGYDQTAEIGGTTYQNVFYLRAGEKAEFTMPAKDTEYYFVELGVLNQEYDYVNINSERIYNSNFSEVHQRQYTDVSSSPDTVSNRKRVIYENHIDPDYLKKLVITKNLVRLEGEEEIPVDDDKTGFEFQVYFLDENGETVPYQKGEYYVTDSDGYYYTYVNGQLAKNGREKVVCSISGNNGSIAGIPDGLSVVIENLLPTTEFFVEEQDSKIPLGYAHLRYERVISGSEATYHLLNDGVYNSGIIKENIDAHMIVTNQKGFGITVQKDWSDNDYTRSHSTIYIALFHIESDGSLQYVEDTIRRLVSPNTFVYYFNDEEEASEYLAREIDPDSIVPSGWNGDLSLVTDCQPYAPNSVTSLTAETLTGETYEFEYVIGYDQGDIGGSGHNIRTDTISNTRDHLKITKQSMDGDPLSGAVFTLTDITDEPFVLGNFTSGSDGLITNAYFSAGHSYLLTEVTAPKGFEKLSAPITILVDATGRIGIQYASDDAELVSFSLSDDLKNGTLTVKDKPKGVILRKVGEEDQPLKDGVFTIYRFDKAQNKKYTSAGFQNLRSDANGVIYDNTLSSGYYLIEEDSPPNGYQKPDYSVVMHIRLSDGAVDELYTVRYNEDTGVYETVENVLDIWVQSGNGSFTVSFPNEKITSRIVIQKTINGIDASKGFPTFLFRVTQTKDELGNSIASGTEYIRYISFSESDTDATKEILLDHLPIGTYKVEELSTLHYTAVGLTVQGDDRAIITSETTASVALSTEDGVTVAYQNRMTEDDTPGFTAFADNKISYSSPQNNEEAGGGNED